MQGLCFGIFFKKSNCQAVNEDFLQFIWEHNLFVPNGLKTISGETLEIISTGKRNFDSGPDFFNARIRIADTEWAGNIEVHKKSSDWEKHNHHHDKAYNNVILHVVETADKPVCRENGIPVPVLEICYPLALKENYEHLMDSQGWVACSNQFFRVDPLLLRIGFNRLMIERLESKTGEIQARLREVNNDWGEAFYRSLAAMFGFRVNAQPFEMVSKYLPSGILAKHKNSLMQTEALIFGCAGMLNEEFPGDTYYTTLSDEFSFLSKKYSLQAIEPHLWKFLRLRPVNFPTIRISQFAALIYKSKGLLSKILEAGSVDEVDSFFRVNASDYWTNHYRFGKESEKKSKKELGTESINILIINVVIPFLFVYGSIQDKPFLKDRALEFLEKLPSEHNSVISGWEKLGIKARNAFESQALLQLKKHYCDNRNCLKCQIGVKILKSAQNG